MELPEQIARQVMCAYGALRAQPALPIELPSLYPAQERIETEAARYNVMDLGRRFGKTYFGVHKALKAASNGKRVGWFAPHYKYLTEAWDDLERPCRAFARINNTERRIELENGGLIEAWSMTDPDAGRSRKYHLAIVDEAAKAPKLKTAWEKAIRPTLTDYRGEAWFLSTPQGLNFFYELFQRGQDRLGYPDWRSWKLPTSVNPFIAAEELESARKDLPRLVYQQEFEAEFISGEGSVFRNLDACLIAQETTPAEHAGHLIVMGLDWGRSHDFTAMSLICCDCGCEVHLDRFNQIGWEFQRGRVVATIQKWRVRYAMIETNSIGSPNLEALRREAPDNVTLIGFETTASSKGPMIEGLALCLEQHLIDWLEDQVAKFEMVAYESTVTESGHVKYGAPEGGFDDTVIARGLAWRQARYKLQRPLSEFEKIEKQLPEHLRAENIPHPSEGWAHEGTAMARELEVAKIKKRVEEMTKGSGDPWKPKPPMGTVSGWEKQWGED